MGRKRMHGLAMAAIVGGALSAAAIVPAAATAKATAEKTSCKKLSGAAKRACAKQNQANRTVLAQLRDSRLVGVRGDGAEVDWLLCASGRYESAVTSSGSTGRSGGSSWRVTAATVKRKGAWFEADVEDPKRGWTVSVGRHGAQWLSAVSFGTRKWGEVTRTDAKADCA
jgi:hypothetical protein